MRYKFKEMSPGETQVIEDQDFTGSAYRMAMRCTAVYGLKFTGTLVPGGIAITRIDSIPPAKTQFDHDVDMISAFIDWGSFPPIMRINDLVHCLRHTAGLKPMKEGDPEQIPDGRAGQVVAGRLLKATKKYNRVRVYTGKKQIWLYAHHSITARGKHLWRMYAEN